MHDHEADESCAEAIDRARRAKREGTVSRMSKRVTTSFRVSHEGQIGVVTVTPRVISSGPSAEPPAPAQPNGVVLTDNTSLDELFTAILGGDAREQDDRGPLLEAVDAQVSRLRKELGLAEPPPPPAPPPTAPQAMQELRAVEAPFGTQTSRGPAVWLRRRFEALRQGMPDVWSSVPRPVMLGLPAMALLVAGAMWLGSADSRPREVAAAAAPTPVATTAAPVMNPPLGPGDALVVADSAPPSSSVPVSALATPGSSVPAGPRFGAAAAPERARDSRGRVSRGGADEGLAGASNASSAARPVPSASSSLADVASPAAPIAAAGSTPTAAPSTAASAATPPFAATGATTTASPAPRADVPVVATAVSPTAATSSVAVAPEPTPAPLDVAATATPAPMPAPAAPPPTSVTSAAPAAPTAPAPATPVSGPPAAPPPGTSATQPAVLLSRATPVYPEAARRARVTGTVDVILSIDKQGTVVRATAVEGSPLLRPSAEDAARKWRYRPELVNGAPVETERRVRIVFQ